MTKIVLRSSGFMNYFFLTLTIIAGWAFIATLGGFIQVFTSGESSRFLGWILKKEDLFLVPFGLVIFGWMVFYFIVYIISNKIVLENNKLSLRHFIPWDEDQSKWRDIIPHKKIVKINLKDIKRIIIDSGENLGEYTYEKNDLFLKGIIESKKKKSMRIPTHYISFAMKRWTFEKHHIFLYITLNDDNKYLITTKPFSKRGVKKLLKELEREIPKKIMSSKI